MYLARELTDQTLPAIGRAFGGRNHTTVMHACRRTAERIAEDPEAYEAVRRLTETLGGPRMSPPRMEDSGVHPQAIAPPSPRGAAISPVVHTIHTPYDPELNPSLSPR